jgi:hypothetical protein
VLRASDESALRSANAAITSGKVPDVNATLRFLVKYPASGWAAKEEFADLKAHCRKAAETYFEEQKKSDKPLAGSALENFRQATEGLGLAGDSRE